MCADVPVFMAADLGFRVFFCVWDLGFRVYGWGFKVQGSGCLEFVAEFGVCNGLLEQEGLTVDGENLALHKISS